jgi:hypothetical protein
MLPDDVVPFAWSKRHRRLRLHDRVYAVMNERIGSGRSTMRTSPIQP